MRWLGLCIAMVSFASIAEERFVKCEFAEGVELNIVFSFDETPRVVGQFVEHGATTVINSPITKMELDGLETYNWDMDVFTDGEKVGTSEKWTQFRGHYYYEKTLFTQNEFPDSPQESPMTMLPCEVEIRKS